MKIFPTLADLIATTGPLSGTEADWGYRLRGAGLPGGTRGWLLTFAYAEGSDTEGHLIAYEIDENSKAGPVGLLRSPWNRTLDLDWVERAHSASWWYARGRNTTGEADIDVVDKFLP